MPTVIRDVPGNRRTLAQVRAARSALRAAALGALLAVGCGGSGSTAHWHGKVTIGGKPLPADAKGTIRFAPPQGSTAKLASAPIVNGEYDSPETPVGKVRVTFDISQEYGPEKKSERTGATYRDARNLVPPVHATGMELEVAGDDLNHDFPL